MHFIFNFNYITQFFHYQDKFKKIKETVIPSLLSNLKNATSPHTCLMS